MIISFSISNFRSFDGEETFSLIASGRVTGTHEDHVVAIPGTDERVLRTAILYGANGAGKSNLFAAIQFFKSLLLDTRDKSSGTSRIPFRLGAVQNAEQATSFDMQFVLGERTYRLGLKLDDAKIIEEWLVEVKGNRERVLYDRVTDADLKVHVELDGLKDVSSRLRALAEVGGLPNQSFLATARGLLGEDDIDSELRAVAVWFEDDVILIGPEDSFRPIALELSSDEDFRKFASEFIRGASTGVDSIEVQRNEITESELKGALPPSTYRRLLHEFEGQGEGSGTIIGSGDGDELIVERRDGIHFLRLAVEAIHAIGDGATIRFPLSEESDGTRRLLNLLPALQKLRNKDAVFVVDEIDRSLHPILVRKFLEFFIRSCAGKQHQLIITTHESSLLDLSLVRRDEIWFAEKDVKGATHLYSLDDFKVRNDLEIRKHYLQGRFGAIPFLGNLDELLGTGV